MCVYVCSLAHVDHVDVPSGDGTMTFEYPVLVFDAAC